MKQSKSMLQIVDIIRYLCNMEASRIEKINEFDVSMIDLHLDEYKNQIESMHIFDLLELYKKQKDIERQEKTDEARFYLDKLRFFNGPEASAYIHHYLSKIKWTHEEAVALCFGKEPKVVNVDSLNAYLDDIENDPDAKYSAFIKGYFNIMDILQSDPAIKEKNSPSFYLKWFNKHRIYICEELQSQVIQRGLAEVSDYQWMEEELKYYSSDDADNLSETEISAYNISVEQHDNFINHTHQVSTMDAQDNVAHKTLIASRSHAKQSRQDDDVNIHERSRNSYLRIIAALIDYIEGATIHEKRYPHFTSLNAFIGFIVDKYKSDNPGLSESHLSHIIPVARGKLNKKKVPQKHK